MMDQFSSQQRQLLAEIGHVYLARESHKMAVKYCGEQLEQLRAQLEQSQASPEQ